MVIRREIRGSYRHEFVSLGMGMMLLLLACSTVPMGGSRPPEFLSTHPAPATRIKQIQALIPEALRYYRQE
jgi:predicted Zn-dependent protease